MPRSPNAMRARQQRTYPPPSLPPSTLQSLRAVLEEDAKFPATKGELIKQQGWKVIDLTEEKRVHAEELFGKLPEKNYQNIEDVIRSINHLPHLS